MFEGVSAGDAGEGGPQRLAGRAPARAAHHRRRPRRARGRPRRGAGRRAWPPSTSSTTSCSAGMKVVGELFGSGRDAAAVRAAVGRDHEGGGRLSSSRTWRRPTHGGKGRIVLATVKGDVHDIGKNLVDIILTNNGYEVHNLGIKVAITEMIDKAAEVKADAIGMSGLLVKSTLIMRENLRRAERAGPRRHPGPPGRGRPDPHLRRARPAPGLRRPAVLRQGRLRGPAHHGPADGAQAERRARPTPTSAGRSAVATCRPRSRRRAPVDHAGRVPPRSPAVATDNPVFVPPFLGLPGRQGHRARRHRGVPQRDRPVPQPVGLPARERRERRPSSRPGSGRAARASWPRPGPAASCARRWPTATSRPTATATTWSSGRTRPAPPEWLRFTFPRQRKEPVALHRRLLPAGRLRRRRTTPPSTS